MTRTLGFSNAMARMAPSMAAPPAMSYFIFSMPSAGLMEMPPVSKVMPLPTRPMTGVAGASFGFIAHHDERGRFVGALRDAPEGAHLQLFDLVGAVGFDFELGQVERFDHAARVLGHHGGSHAIAGLVDQFAGEILRLAHDAALLDGGAQGVAVVQPWPTNEGEFVDALVLAVAAVFVGIEVADEGAFDHGLDGVGRAGGQLAAGRRRSCGWTSA